MYDWIPTNIEANPNTIGGTILISVSELCFDIILVDGSQAERHPTQNHSALRCLKVHHASLMGEWSWREPEWEEAVPFPGGQRHRHWISESEASGRLSQLWE